jgi:hypothetical protein
MRETAARLAQHRVITHERLAQPHLAVPADGTRIDGPHPVPDLPAGIAGINQEHGRALGRTRPIGFGHHDREPGPVRAGDEVLVTVQPPAARDLTGHRRQGGRVGPGTRRRFGHRETRTHVSAHQRPQVTLLLLLGANHRQQVHVALIRRGAVHCQRAQRAVTRLFQQHRAGQEVSPASPVLRRGLRGEKAGVVSQLLQLDPQLVIDTGGEGFLLQRDDVVRDEVPHRLTDRLGVCRSEGGV